MRNARHKGICALGLAGGLVVIAPIPSSATISFSDAVRIVDPAPGGPTSIVADDVVDGSPTCSGCLDLVVVNRTGDSVTLLAGNGSGGFSQVGSSLSVGNNPYYGATGDCDGDGDDDIFVANNASSNATASVTVLRNGRVGGTANTFTTSTITGINARPVFVLSRTSTGGALDLNGDGKLDLVLAIKGNDKLLTLYGNGSCGFSVQQNTIAGGNGPEVVTAGDFNGDSLVDLAVSDRLTGGGVIVLYNKGTDSGNGRFAITGDTCNCTGCGCTTFTPVGNEPSAVLARNFNADGGGALDLAITDSNNTDSISTTGLLLMTGDGSGGFSGPNSYGTQAKGPEAVVAADFNNDSNHYLDAVVLDKTANQISFLNGKGANGFDTGVTYDLDGGGSTPAKGPEDITLGDFDGDGDIDVATANKTTNNFSVCLNNGSGVFSCTPTSANPSGFGTGPRGIAITDQGTSSSTTPDGSNDIVVVNETSDDVTFLFQTSSGFDSLRPPVSLAANATTLRDLLAFDANGTAPLDLAIAACGGSGQSKDRLVVIRDRNFNNSTSPTPQYLGSSGEDCPTAVAYGDLNGDTYPDLVTVNANTNNLTIYQGFSTGSFSKVRDICVAGTSTCDDTNPTDVAIAEFGTSSGNPASDSKLDIAVTAKDTGTVRIFYGDGALDVSSSQTVAVFPAAGQPQALAVEDFNGDGKNDLAVVNHNTTSSTVTTAKGVQVAMRQSDGTFSSSPTNLDCGKQPYAIAAANVSRDTAGRKDLVVTSEGSDQTCIFEGKGDGTFDTPVIKPVGTNPRAVAVGDIDTTAGLDIAVANHNSDDVSVIYNTSPSCGDSTVSGNEQCDPPGAVCSSGCGGTTYCTTLCKCP